MKVSNIQYADALYESAKGKSRSEINELVANFVRILAKNNQVKNVNNIISKFKEIWNKKEGIMEAEVVSREKLSSQLVGKLINFVGRKYNARNVEIKSIVDKNIKGGIIIRVGDEVLDGSVSGQLKKLKSSLEK